MTSGSQPVKMRVNNETKLVGTATYPIYDAIQEAIDSIGEAKTLELLNAQTRTNEMNRVRGLARGGPSKTHLRNQALATLTAEEFMSVAGNLEKLEALLESKMEAIKAQTLANIAAGTGTPEDEDEENV